MIFDAIFWLWNPKSLFSLTYSHSSSIHAPSLSTDAFGTLYLGYASLWYYQQNKNVEGIDALFELSMENLLKQNQVRNCLFLTSIFLFSNR